MRLAVSKVGHQKVSADAYVKNSCALRVIWRLVYSLFFHFPSGRSPFRSS